MQSEEKEYGVFPDEEEILNITDELAELLCNTDGYRRYKKHLAALKEQPEVYQQLNEFRLKNIELQLEKDEHYYEKAEELQLQYKNILMESVVMDFLTSEQRICKLMRKIYDRIALKVNLDVSYMDQNQ